MENLNRFNIVMRSDSDVYELEDSPTGKYVKFSDVEEALRSTSDNTAMLEISDIVGTLISWLPKELGMESVNHLLERVEKVKQKLQQ